MSQASDESTNDLKLIRRCQAGDQDAFEGLYGRYRLQLYSYLGKMLSGNSHLVDDLFQQTWIRVLDNLGRYEHRQRFISWLFRIAHNLVVDHVRRHARREMVEVDDRLADESVGEAWEDMDRETLLRAVAKGAETLSPEQQEVLALRQQGVPFREIAEIQDASINTVLGRMHYAVKRLRRMLCDYVTDDPLEPEG
ncbi:MAG: sigma-70 family RNA polymerase sigma factor [Victivallales bacterium]|jgi:RNA polymerase sigma-70 factor, ECF subfamily|nr:sigma-70 family RNA polymerase sigma factor [Victivallales bacterium]MBT7165706.1 sigma-70 family RNA polymerase sigma factor [Victivallales bacterium]